MRGVGIHWRITHTEGIMHLGVYNCLFSVGFPLVLSIPVRSAVVFVAEINGIPQFVVKFIQFWRRESISEWGNSRFQLRHILNSP